MVDLNAGHTTGKDGFLESFGAIIFGDVAEYFQKNLDLPLFKTGFQGYGLKAVFLEQHHQTADIEAGIQGFLIHEELLAIENEHQG